MGKFAAILTGGAMMAATSVVSAQAMPVQGGLAASVSETTLVQYGYGGGYRVYHPWLHRGYGYGGGYRVYHPWLHRGYGYGYGGGYRVYHPSLHRGYGYRGYHRY